MNISLIYRHTAYKYIRHTHLLRHLANVSIYVVFLLRHKMHTYLVSLITVVIAFSDNIPITVFALAARTPQMVALNTNLKY